LLFWRSIFAAGCPQIFGMSPSPDPEIQWVLEALAKDPSKSRKGLGDAIGLDKTGVSKLLSGRRALKMREGIKISEYLGVTPPIGFAEDPSPYSASAAAPVFRASADPAEAFWRLYRNEAPIDRRQRAPHFASASRVFGLYAPDDSMAPRFKAGELIFADPSRPVVQGDDVLFIARHADGGEQVVVAELVKTTPSYHLVNQHGRPGERRLPAKTWAACLVLRGY
jgi:hypothetical protein